MLTAIIIIQVIQTIVLLGYMLYKENIDFHRSKMDIRLLAPIHRTVCYQDSPLYQQRSSLNGG